MTWILFLVGVALGSMLREVYCRAKAKQAKFDVHVQWIGEDPRQPGSGILVADLVVNDTPHIRLEAGDDLILLGEKA